MPISTTLAAPHIAAVLLAAVGAVLFGLAAVRQHGAVQTVADDARDTVGERLRSTLALVRHPAWLVGAVQAGIGGLLHIAALALAPITLVQPIGVLAVPVAVVAAAVRHGRAPRPAQLCGTAMAVVGIGVLTVFLLRPATVAPTVPGWPTLMWSVAGVLAAGVVVTVTGGRGKPLVRCVSLAVAAAVLFGINSVLIRTIGAVLTTGGVTGGVGVLIIAGVGIAVALPLGVWAMQSAYTGGSPQVVICCLTLVDPLAAVAGGRLLLHDGGPILGLTLAGVLISAAVASVGVVLLSADYPVEETAGDVEPLAVTTTARPGPN